MGVNSSTAPIINTEECGVMPATVLIPLWSMQPLKAKGLQIAQGLQSLLPPLKKKKNQPHPSGNSVPSLLIDGSGSGNGSGHLLLSRRFISPNNSARRLEFAFHIPRLSPGGAAEIMKLFPPPLPRSPLRPRQILH